MNATTRTRSLYDEALEAVSAGISVVPPVEDGSKRPITAWAMFQKNIPPLGRIRRWYETKGHTGLGVVCGAVSGKLEVLDFDAAHAYTLFRDTADAMGLGDVLDRIAAGYLEQTPSGGMHLLYRCPEIAGNLKLARDEDGKALIETRGEGGYVVTAPSHGAVHASGKPYERLSGSFSSIVTVTPQERAELHRLARALDRMPDETPLPPIGSTKRDGDGDRPGDLYIAGTTWHDLLPAHGWTAVRTIGETTYWRRPGKEHGISATTNRHGNDLLWMFTSSTAFEPDRSYTRFGAYAVLEHGGDFKAATKVLAAAGYRAERPAPSTFTVGGDNRQDGAERADLDDTVTTENDPVKGWKIGKKLPRLDAGCQDLALMSGLAWAAVERRNDPPRMFTYAGEPIRLDPDDDGNPTPRPLSPERLRHEAARAAEWYTVRKVKEEWIESPGKPNKDLITDMLALPSVPLPALSRVVAAPVFSSTGSLETTDGYHPASRTYYHAADGLTVPDVPERPTRADVDEAKRWLLDELLCDFPFVSDADRAHAVAELLLTPARALIPGAAPLHVHEAPTQGTGKDLLAEAMGIVVLGREPHTMSYGREPEEFEKRLVATLRTMPEWVVLPNVRGEVTNDALADAISRGMFTGRILGLSDMARLPARNVWTLTANNAELSADFTRRSIRVRLDAQMERPQARVDFKHPQLKPWVRRNRARLVWATLTLVRAWVAAGRPPGTASLGGFEDWSETIGGILAHAEIPGFLGNLEEFYQAADGEAITRRAFVAAWWDRFNREAVGTASLFPIATDDEINMDLGSGSDRSQRTKLGTILRTMRDRRYTLQNGYTVRVTSGNLEHNAQTYRLDLIDRGDDQ